MSIVADQRQYAIAAIRLEREAYENAVEVARYFVAITPSDPVPLLAALNALTAATAAREAALAL